MKLDYARVSTEDQILQLQRPRLSAAGCEKVFEEKIAGAARHRPELEKLAAVDKYFAGIEIDVADLDMNELDHAHDG